MSNGLHVATHFITNYLCFSLFGFIVLMLMNLIMYSTSPMLPIESPEVLNFSQDPKWFLHTSDIHLAQYYPGPVAHFIWLLRLCNSTIFPMRIVITGDLVDGFISNFRPCKSGPNESQWELYSSIINESKIERCKFIEVLGNHDTWGILDRSSPYNFGDKFTDCDSSNFASVETVDGLRLIKFFPVAFPSGVGIHNSFVTVTKEMLDSLESALSSATNATNTIVLCHFNYKTLFPKAFSSKGKSYETIIKENNITAILSGHCHPGETEYFHFGNTVEVTSTPLCEWPTFGVFTIDNGRFSYSTLYLTDTSPAVLTYPIPSRVASRIYSENSFQIRLLSFSSKCRNFTVVGDVNGVLNKVKEIESGVWLYSLPVTVKPGKHKINIVGDANIECEFAINATDGGFSERQNTCMIPNSIITGIILFFILNSLVIFGMLAPKSFVRDSIKTAQFEAGTYTEGYWLNVILVGPIVVGARMRKLPILEKIFVTIFVFAPTFLPNINFKIEDATAHMWMFWYTANGSTRIDLFCGIFMVIYECTIVYPLLLALSLVCTEFQKQYLDDILIISLVFAVGEYKAKSYGLQVAFDGTWIQSIYFVILPSLMIFTLLIFIFEAIIEKIEKRSPKP